jgi:uncharacterized protein YbjT (DUF2867 family)
MTVLVTGATGNVGRLVVDQLVAARERVRVLTRNPAGASFPAGVEVVAGDLTQPATLAPALVGVERMFLFPLPWTAPEVTALARAAGVARIVVLSSGAVTAGLDTAFHLPVEQAVEKCGAAWTHVRPGEFALNRLYLWGPTVRAERVVRDPFPDSLHCPVHERDVADVAVAALREDGHEGVAYTLNGPGWLSTRDQADAIADALGEPVLFEQVSREQAREQYRAQGGFAAANADFLLGFTTYAGDEAGPDEAPPAPEPRPRPTAEQVTGRPARSFAQWARDHAADFRR